METIRTEQLAKSFKGVFRLEPLDLRVAPGEILGVMGPHEAGKTTLLRLLWGFTRPDQGRIFIFGLQPHLEQVKVRLRAGYVSQHPQFYPRLSARQFLRFIGHFYEGWDEKETNTLLEHFGIDPDIRMERLSKGLRTQVAIVSAMAHQPSLVILDEPTSGLEHPIRREILTFLQNLARQKGVSILVSSDISDDLNPIADSILTLNRGRVVEYARNKHCS
jgi:ABC-2 type transport system ATP-binding protein